MLSQWGISSSLEREDGGEYYNQYSFQGVIFKEGM